MITMLRNFVRSLGFIVSCGHPQMGGCLRCRQCWDCLGPAARHGTAYQWGWGLGSTAELALMFPLCGSCHVKLRTPTARLPYYAQLFDRWQANGPDFSPDVPWEQIALAVWWEALEDGDISLPEYLAGYMAITALPPAEEGETS